MNNPGSGGCSFNGSAQPYEMTCDIGCDPNGGCAIVGQFQTHVKILTNHKGMYSRKSYNADPKECCLSSALTIGDLTCDPDYRSYLNKG